MNSTKNPFLRMWKWWFTTRSTDPTVAYRERALRFLLPIFLLFRVLWITNLYSDTSTANIPFFPLWITVIVFVVPYLLVFYSLFTNHIDWAGTLFVANWYLTDMLNLPGDGYWNAGFQISLVIQVVLAALLLSSRLILIFLVFQITTVGIWGYWLNLNHFTPPLLSSGEPIANYTRTIITISVQETIILLIVRYLRLAMEKSLRVQQSTIEEVNVKNAELERFTYTVSHELKTPVVTIKNYLGSVDRDLGTGNHERIKKDLSRISSAADKLHNSIYDLLELSRIGRVINPPEEIELGELVQESLQALENQISENNIKVRVDANLPIIYGDHKRLREVLDNLLENAIKNMGEQSYPSIEIGMKERENGNFIFQITDNGVGIEPQYHERIFDLFEQLNPAIEGTGIGLTLIKRIIEFHGGEIWVESEGLGKGSTFCFTIPDKRTTSK